MSADRHQFGGQPGGDRAALPASVLIVATLLVVIVFSILATLRPPQSRLWGDESTYVAMAASLAHDLDLWFDERDLERERVVRPPGPDGLILHRVGDRYGYSKPILHALFAAPFYRLFGVRGIVAQNVIALILASLLGYLWLERMGDSRWALLAMVTFVGCSAILPYVLWRMTEVLVVALVLAGLVLSVAIEREPWRSGRLDRLLARHRWLPFLGAALLGLAASLRYSNAAIATVPALTALLGGRWRRAVGMAAASAGALTVVLGLGVLLAGVANPYAAPRAGFGPATGYPVGVGSERAAQQLVESSGTRSDVTATFDKRVGYAAVYSLVGRHTGLAVYFPAALAFMLASIRRPDRVTLSCFVAAVAVIVFYLVWVPHNYFGGGTFVGNRYFLGVYPVLLLMPTAIPGKRCLVVVWALAAIVAVSVVSSVWATGAVDTLSQSHANRGIFRALPYESTAPDLDGRRDRYWRGDFVRFTDPFAMVGADDFTIDSGGHAPELLIVKAHASRVHRFLVSAPVPDLDLELSDWGGRQLHRLRATGDSLREIVELEGSRAWRRHAFWWVPDAIYDAYAIQLRARVPDGTPVTVELRYMGAADVEEWRFDREVLQVELPTRAVVGHRSRLRVRVRNSGQRTWSSEDTPPVYLAYRLYRDSRLDQVIDGRRTILASPVGVGEVLDGVLEVDWPHDAGDYRLVIDLIQEGVAWFEERLGEPLAFIVVPVEAAGSAGATDQLDAPSQRDGTGG